MMIMPATAMAASHSAAVAADSHGGGDWPVGDPGSAVPGIGDAEVLLAKGHDFEFATNPRGEAPCARIMSSTVTVTTCTTAPAAPSCRTRGGSPSNGCSVDAHWGVKEAASSSLGGYEAGTEVGTYVGPGAETMTAGAVVSEGSEGVEVHAEGPPNVTGTPADATPRSYSFSQALVMAACHPLAPQCMGSTCAVASEASADMHASESGEEDWQAAAAPVSAQRVVSIKSGGFTRVVEEGERVGY